MDTGNVEVDASDKMDMDTPATSIENDDSPRRKSRPVDVPIDPTSMDAGDDSPVPPIDDQVQTVLAAVNEYSDAEGNVGYVVSKPGI